jgi:hypothetical protein
VVAKNGKTDPHFGMFYLDRILDNSILPNRWCSRFLRGSQRAKLSGSWPPPSGVGASYFLFQIDVGLLFWFV